jgi:hypothetical protein
MFPIATFTDAQASSNGAIVKFYGFREHARKRDNIITAPEHILVEITDVSGNNIEIPGLRHVAVPPAPVKFSVLVQRRASWKVGPLGTIRSNTRIRTYRFRSSGSHDVAWCSTRHLETSTGDDAIGIPSCPTFVCHLTRHRLHSQTL